MARSCGIRLGPRRYEIVVLDGSAKKHKIAAFEAGEFDPLAPDPEADAAKTLKEAARRLGLPKENIGLVIDPRHAAFRRVSMPFADRAKIEQVIKYEVEGDLPQWDIEDVVVDHHVTGGSGSDSDILVTAVPKDDLQAALDVCGRAGIEPLEAELETSAMVNAAHTAQICSLDTAQLLVHIGDYSTSVVVVDAGQVREMRVIHIGALTHEVLPSPEATASEEEGGEASDEEQEAEESSAPNPEVDPIEASRRVDQAIKRIRRELGRTLSGARTLQEIEAIYVCGMELPGLVGSTVLDVPVYILDCFEEDSGQPADGFGQLVAAYGAAVRELGGGLLSPSLRREELRYTGTWERIEFPLAVACLLLTTLLGVIAILQHREINLLLENGARFWMKSGANFLVGEPEKNTKGHMWPVPQSVQNFVKRVQAGEDPGDDPLETLDQWQRLVQSEVDGLEKSLGQDASVTQPQSALVGTYLVLSVLESEHEKWRPSLRKIVAETQPARSGGNPESVKVTLDFVLFADDMVSANRHYDELRRAFESEREWFVKMPLRSSIALENGKGVSIKGLPITVNVQAFYDSLGQEARVAQGGPQ